jgi:8-amino-7-oxononanoate synthase
MDIFEKAFNYTTAKEVKEAGIYPYFLAMSGNEGTEAIYQGNRIIMCGSNNYLGLTTHPSVRQATQDAVEKYGTSCTGSRFLNGTLEMHLELENELAEYVEKDAALVFSTGMQVNLGTISSIVGKGEVAILDKDDHASILDGARLSWGTTKRYRHNDITDFERVLESVGPDTGKLVVVDGLFSMEGDIAPLPEIIPLCKKYGARLMVDDAHAIGVLGRGRGTAAHFNMTDDVDLIMGTFSKSFASLGGFIAGDAQVIDFIQHNARSLIFSASIPPAPLPWLRSKLCETNPNELTVWARLARKCVKDSQRLALISAIQLRLSSPSLLAMIGRPLSFGGLYWTPVYMLTPSSRPQHPQTASFSAPATWPPTQMNSSTASSVLSNRSAKS